MALCSFAGIGFDLDGNDGDDFIPLPSDGIDGAPTLDLTICVFSRADAVALYGLRTRATMRQAIGTFTGRAVIHAGAGPATLEYPTGADASSTQQYSALLTGLTLSRHEFEPGYFRGQATFTLLSDIYPDAP